MKRPLCICFLVFLLGLLIGYQSNGSLFFCGLMLMIVSISSILLFKTYERKWVLTLPLICFFSFYLMTLTLIPVHKEFDNLFEDRLEGTFVGKVQDYYFQGERLYAILQVNEFIAEDYTYHKPLTIRVTFEGSMELRLGDILEGKGTLYKLEEPRNEGAWDEKSYYRIRGIDYRFYSVDAVVRHRGEWFKQGIKEFNEQLKHHFYKLLPEKEAGIVSAMVLGDRNGLDSEVREAYQKSGIIHILAISGLHITLLGLTLFGLLRKMQLPIKLSAISSIGFLVFYAYLTGSSISTLRAVIMVSTVLVSYLLGRTYDLYSALSFAAILLLIINPLYLFDAGFQLSFAAVLGISILTPYFECLFNKDHKIIKLFCASLSAYISTLPIVAYYYFEIPLYAVFVNVLVIPLLTILVPLSLISSLIGFLSMTLAKLLIGLAFFILKFYDLLSQWVLSIPFSGWVVGRPSLWTIILIYAFIGLVICFTKYKIKQRILWGSFIVSVILLKCIPTNELSITFLDVGQGDAIFMDGPKGETFLIDGGGLRYEDVGIRRIIPFLKYHGITKIDFMFLSHGDMDHTLGLLEVLDHVKVRHLFIPKTEFKNELIEEIIFKAQEKGVQVVELGKGDVLSLGPIVVECLHPNEGLIPRKNNDHSMVLSVKYKSFNMLLTGDIEREDEVLPLMALEQHILLKVPHHGSNTSSTSAFLESVQPQIGIISSGKNNSYGHPHQEVIDRYESYDTILYNTATYGAIRVTTDGDKYRITTKLKRKE